MITDKDLEGSATSVTSITSMSMIVGTTNAKVIREGITVIGGTIGATSAKVIRKGAAIIGETIGVTPTVTIRKAITTAVDSAQEMAANSPAALVKVAETVGSKLENIISSPVRVNNKQAKLLSHILIAITKVNDWVPSSRNSDIIKSFLKGGAKLGDIYGNNEEIALRVAAEMGDLKAAVNFVNPGTIPDTLEVSLEKEPINISLYTSLNLKKLARVIDNIKTIIPQDLINDHLDGTIEHNLQFAVNSGEQTRKLMRGIFINFHSNNQSAGEAFDKFCVANKIDSFLIPKQFKEDQDITDQELQLLQLALRYITSTFKLPPTPEIVDVIKSFLRVEGIGLDNIHISNQQIKLIVAADIGDIATTEKLLREGLDISQVVTNNPLIIELLMTAYIVDKILVTGSTASLIEKEEFFLKSPNFNKAMADKRFSTLSKSPNTQSLEELINPFLMAEDGYGAINIEDELKDIVNPEKKLAEAVKSNCYSVVKELLSDGVKATRVIVEYETHFCIKRLINAAEVIDKVSPNILQEKKLENLIDILELQTVGAFDSSVHKDCINIMKSRFLNLNNKYTQAEERFNKFMAYYNKVAVFTASYPERFYDYVAPNNNAMVPGSHVVPSNNNNNARVPGTHGVRNNKKAMAPGSHVVRSNNAVVPDDQPSYEDHPIVFCVTEIVYNNLFINHPSFKEIYKIAKKKGMLSELDALGEDKEVAETILEAIKEYGAADVMELVLTPKAIINLAEPLRITDVSIPLRNVVVTIDYSMPSGPSVNVQDIHACPEAKFLSGMLLSKVIIAPTLSYATDKLKGENTDKSFIDYYKEATQEVINNLAKYAFLSIAMKYNPLPNSYGMVNKMMVAKIISDVAFTIATLELNNLYNLCSMDYAKKLVLFSAPTLFSMTGASNIINVDKIFKENSFSMGVIMGSIPEVIDFLGNIYDMSFSNSIDPI